MNKSLLAVAAVLAATAFAGVASAEKIPGADQGGIRLTATFSGLSQVNPTGDPDATGTAVVTLNYGLGQICWDYTIQNAYLPTFAAHIHRGVAGQNGPPVIGFTPPDEDGHSSGCVENVPRELIAEIRDNPAGFYAHAHNSEYPAGVVRGQLNH